MLIFKTIDSIRQIDELEIYSGKYILLEKIFYH